MADSRPGPDATATVSSLKSEDSTEQLICKTPLDVKKSVSSKSVDAVVDDAGGRKLVVVLGLLQVVLGALLVGAGAAGVVKGAALARVGAGLWAGCVAVVAGVVGVLAGINDCYGLNSGNSSPLLTAFLALSLLCLACGNSAAVLAATGLQRDTARAPHAPASFEDEMQAWSPVLANIAVLIISTAHCLVCVASIYHVSRRVCPCFRARPPYDHNQFEPFKPQPYVVHVDETRNEHDLCKDLEKKLDTLKKKGKDEPPEYGSANSKEKLVSHWLGRQPPPAPVVAGPQMMTGPPVGAGVGLVARGRRAPRHPQVVLLPAPPHQHSTLGRMPVGVMVPPRYATLPLPPAQYAPPARLYYPLHDARFRRRRSPRERRAERKRRDERERERDSKLTRSLERIHRKRRAERARPSDADLKRTYTGLDRAYAEQFIAVCDESRHAAESHDSLASTASDAAHSQATA